MDELRKITKKMMAEKSIEDYDLNIQGTIGKGENYLGEVLFFTITPNNEANVLYFVRKQAKYSKDEDEKSAMSKASQREFYVYRVVYPEMKKFLELQKNEVALTIIPEVHCIYEEDNKEVLIMENMKYSGFKMHNKKLPMNRDQISLVLETYAKFHSISFAMKELAPENFKEISESMSDVWINFKYIFGTDNYFGPLLKDVLGKLKEAGRSDLASKYKPIEDNLENIVFINVEEEDRLVICHGDAWNNNMLFKNDENGVPKSVCLIDFQMSSLSTPILDLCQFLFSACDKDVLYNIEEYLKMYHQLLKDALEKYNIEVDRIFSFDKLMDHWSKYSKCGVIVALSIIQFSLAEDEEIPDDLNSLNYSDSSEMKNSETFTNRVNDLLISFAEKFL